MATRARLLSTPPISGTVEERQFEAFGACTWVEFVPENDLPWVGVFGHHGVAAHSCVCEFPGAPFAFVIARGVGWVVNLENGDLAFKTTQNCLAAATPFSNKPFVVAVDWTNIYVYGIDGHFWSSDRVAIDGIRFDEQPHEDSITGQCWKGDWIPFQLHSNPWRIAWVD